MPKAHDDTEVIEPTIVEDTEEISDEDASALLQGMQLDMATPEVWSPTTLVFYGPDSRHILLATDIDTEEATAIVSQIKQLEAESPEEPIFMTINSHGGSIHDALAIYDALRGSSCPIVTIVEGNCMSAAGLIHAAGDVRLCNKHAVFFYHQPIVSEMSIDSPLGMAASSEHYKWSKQTLDEIQRERYGIKKRVWDKEFGESTARYFYAEEALKLGIVHAVVPYKKKAPIDLDNILEFYFK